ncbi:MAG TPA: potassium transporter Kup [Caldimonas sp.]
MDHLRQRQSLGGLILGALGVVYGDIGTSPLYTMKEVFSTSTGVPLDSEHLIGASSTIFWALMIVVTLKYVVLILRADNHGEGGIMALTALAVHAAGTTPRRKTALLLIGVFGAALFYGDSVITPAISVLGAAEGLEVVAPTLKPWVVPISVAILVGLFLVQRHGTRRVGNAFGPIVLVWFGVLAVTGGWQIALEPAVLQALDPRRAFAFLHERGWHLFAAVGAIVLALTGAEALYADMGHFGRRPIQIAWTGLVLPSLMLNYLGQAALLMREPGALENPFFRLFSSAWLLPAVVLATCAAIIASQAVISGAYSMTRQAIQLGFLPRMRVDFTSASAAGQVYLPAVNRVLLIAVVAAAIGFGSSSALAAAYGIAVTVTMFITTLLTFFVVRHAWRYPLPLALAASGFFLAFDGLLVASCAVKFVEGGWFPLAFGAAIFVVMATWKSGRERLFAHGHEEDLDLAEWIGAFASERVPRSSRTAVYAVADTSRVPQALLHNLKHNQVLHERNVILNVAFRELPFVDPANRVQVTPLGAGFWRVQLRYGFMEVPDVPAALDLCRAQGLEIDLFQVSYFLSREIIVPSRGAPTARWRQTLFAAMSRNAGSVADFFRLPDNCVVELGTRVQL